MRLRTEIVFNLVIIMVFSMLLIGIFILKFNRDLLVEGLISEHKDYSREIIQRYGSSLEQGLGFDPESRLIRIISGISASKKGFEFSLYRIEDRKVLLIWGREPYAGKDRMSAFHSELVEYSSQQPVTKAGYSRVLGLVKRLENVDTIVPLRGAANQRYVVFFYGGWGSEEKGIRRIKIAVISYTVVFALIISVFGYVLLSKSIVKPLELISSKAAKIAQGDLGFHMEKFQTNEIGELAESIKTMTEKLLAKERELKDNLMDLQRLNEALKEAKNEIVRAEKLASIGRLSSGIAHEIGNPLSAVLGYVEILKRDAKSDEERDILIRSEAELQRVSRIIKQLLDFSRPVQAEAKLTDMNSYIKDIIRELELSDEFRSIEVEYRPMAGIPEQEIDPGLLKQVLVNLLKNAAFAVNERHGAKGGGKITLDLSMNTVSDLKELKNAFYFNIDKRSDDPPEVSFLRDRRKRRSSDPPRSRLYRSRGRGAFVYPKFLFDESEPLLKVSVEDNGSGIKRENLKKIFDPFYTTKDPGSGVGLGLYMTLNHIDNMGGYIDVVSEEGKGTMFLILLPVKRGFS